MSPAELAWWQDQAALLDPDAYEFVSGAETTRTVPGDENWYLQEGWFLEASGGGVNYFHRAGDVRDALPLPAGTVVKTDTHGSNDTHMYLCKPSLVTGSDARYETDPRGLYFERLRYLATEATLHQIGNTVTNNSVVTATFPTDFTNGMVVHVSIHDIAWLIPLDSAETAGLITQPEISDEDRARFANNVLIPFKRTTFPKIQMRGASQTEGRGTLTYVKLPGGW